MAKPEGPKIITENREAKEHFRQLQAAGFTVRQHGHIVEEEEFVEAYGSNLELWVRPKHSAGGDVTQAEQDAQVYMELISSLDPHSVYENLIDSDFLIYLPGEVVDNEDVFSEIAATQGVVDLEKVRKNGQVFRTFGSRIGWSSSNGPKVQ